MSLNSFADKARKLAQASSDPKQASLVEELLAMAVDKKRTGIALTTNKDAIGRVYNQPKRKTTLRDKRGEVAA